MANKVRGEDIITLGGVDYRLRPSHEAINAIEDDTGESLIDLVLRGQRMALPRRHMAIIATHLIRAGATRDVDKRVSVTRIGELIAEESIRDTQLPITAVLSSAASGGRTASGEVKAAVANDASTIAA